MSLFIFERNYTKDQIYHNEQNKTKTKNKKLKTKKILLHSMQLPFKPGNSTKRTTGLRGWISE